MDEAFRMVVLGDSIMWGQGLADHEKFSTKIQNWLAVQLARPMDLEVLAHSRAVIAADEVQDLIPARPGEIPHKYPSITAQAKQVTNPSEVDLLLVDGGIDDMGAEKIVNPLHMFDLDWIREQASVYCGKMKDFLLSVILPRFPRAVIIVAGYYPLISPLSDPLKTASLTDHLCPGFLALGKFIEVIENNFLLPLARQSGAWAQASDRALRDAVETANARAKNAGSGDANGATWWMASLASAAPPAPPQVDFAPVNFGPEHCYAAPNTLLWTLGEADSVMPQRIKQCLQYAAGDPTCPVQAAFHPNRQGAVAYEEAIKTVLATYIPFWREDAERGG